MISRLRGLLLAKTPPVLLIEVQGVGYDVFVPMTTLYQLPEPGVEVILHTHFIVREDVQQLYGFATETDRELFRTLIKVNGVGPKMALAIMSGMEPRDLVRCVRMDNVAALTKIPGVGKKTAERLLIELRDKLAGQEAGDATAAASLSGPGNHDRGSEAEDALVALGYKPAEATRMVSAALKEVPAASSQELIRFALRAAVKV